MVFPILKNIELTYLINRGIFLDFLFCRFVLKLKNHYIKFITIAIYNVRREKVKGYIQVYTGDGKGKTTAALGLAVRAVCAGKKVFFGQFVKGMEYSELDAIKFLPNFVMEQFGRPEFIHGKPTKADIDNAIKGLKRIEEILTSNEYDLVVLDEANIALFYELFTLNDLLKVISVRSENTEIVITGRKAPEALIQLADLVTEMKEIKHYYQKGVLARKGIEY